ncbi:MAG: AI-2E family transporter [Candidatus Omnitrophica bacterium]|nr:AI-2E family transporter [Candidatus Omnitrophota bacterium]
MTKNQLVSIFFIALFLFILHQVLKIFAVFSGPIFWGAILAFSFYPLHDRLRKFLGPRDWISALLVTLFVFLAFVPIALVMMLNLAGEAVKFYEWFASAAAEGKLKEMVDAFRALPPVQRVEGLFPAAVLQEKYYEWILRVAAFVGNWGAKQAAFITRNLFSIPVNILLTFLLVFFFLKDGHAMYRFLYGITPLEEKDKQSIFSQTTGAFHAVLRGQVLTGLAQAASSGIIFFALGLPLPVLFASITFFTSLIPILGASIVWISLAAWLVTQKMITKAVILTVLGIFGISLIDNFMKPYLIGERTKLPYLVLFLGILGGLKIYGLAGIFLAPAVLSLCFTLIKIYQEKYL